MPDLKMLSQVISTTGTEKSLWALCEVLVYPDASAEATWDADSPDSPPNSMLYLILSTNFITVVLDDPTTADMHPILESIRKMMWMYIFDTYAEAA